MTKALIFGKGQLGEEYHGYFSANPAYTVSVAEGIDIRDLNGVRQAIISARPDIVFNTAAKTDIDWCETNRLETFAVNALGADQLGRVCQELGIYFVHISRGCVQESKTADEIRGEDDVPNPLCFYAWCKVWAENLLMDRLNRRGIGSDFEKPLKILILRPRQLLSAKLSKRNALAKMLTYDKFVDTPNSCTVVEDLMRATEELISRGATGIYNVANPGVTSPYKIANLLKELVRPEMQFKKISKEELNWMTLARRIDSVLSLRKLESAGIKLPNIDDRLREIILELKNNLEGGGAELLDEVAQATKAKLSLKL